MRGKRCLAPSPSVLPESWLFPQLLRVRFQWAMSATTSLETGVAQFDINNESGSELLGLSNLSCDNIGFSFQLEALHAKFASGPTKLRALLLHPLGVMDPSWTGNALSTGIGQPSGLKWSHLVMLTGDFSTTQLHLVRFEYRHGETNFFQQPSQTLWSDGRPGRKSGRHHWHSRGDAGLLPLYLPRGPGCCACGSASVFTLPLCAGAVSKWFWVWVPIFGLIAFSFPFRFLLCIGKLTA